MLIRLTPDQVSEKWPELSQAIIDSFEYMPEATPHPATVLEWLMDLTLQCWVNLPEGSTIPNGVVTTAIVPNTPFKTHSLLVFSLWASTKGDSPSDWDLGLDTLREYARTQGCTDVIMFTKTPSVKAFLSRRASHKDFYYLKV